jgi:hypothetical protein
MRMGFRSELVFRVSLVIFVEEIIPLIIGKDECRHMLNPYLSYSFHSKVFEVDQLNRLDIFLRKNCSRATY